MAVLRMLTFERTNLRPAPVWRRLYAVVSIVLAWTVVAVVAVGQVVVSSWLKGERVDGDAVLRLLAILPLWAAATPGILWSARRYPLDSAQRWRHAAIHLALGTAFIVLANILVRLPWHIGPDGAPGLWHSLGIGLSRYYPLALVVYGVIVGVGHALPRSVRPPPVAGYVPGPVEERAHPARQAATPAAVAVALEPEAPRLVIRAWNRVHLVRQEDIDWIEASDNYVRVHVGDRSYKGRERISQVASRIDPTRFVRIHRSAIVQLSKIREVQPLTHGDHVVVLHCGKKLRVARTRRAMLEAALGTDL